ncbi:glutathione S-transferase, partial [Rhizobium ruizarguesonis]
TWVRGADIFYGGREVLEYANFPAVSDWLACCIARPARARGLNIPVKPE